MNILIIGLGSIAQKHIHAIKELFPVAVIYALRSINPSPPVNDVQNIYSIGELAVKPDYAIICNPTYLHAEAILLCAELGVPLMIEKPVFHSLEDANKIMSLISEKNIITYIGCNLRFHPAIKFLKEHVENNDPRINEVNIYCGSYLPDWRPGKDFKTIYSANANMGGGVHLDLIHEIDYCRWIFGKPNHTLALRRNVSSLEISAVDYAHYNLTYDSFVASITLNYFRRETKRTLEILFDNVTWMLDLPACEIRDHSGKIIFKEDFNILNTYTDQMKYFTDHIKHQHQPMNSIEEAVEVLKICLTNE